MSGIARSADELLDRLVRRAVLAESDRVVRVDVDHALLHERGEPDRRPHVVREDQERAAERDDAAVQRHAVHDRRHAVLANAEMHVARGVVVRREVLPRLDRRVVRRRQVGRAADRARAATSAIALSTAPNAARLATLPFSFVKFGIFFAQPCGQLAGEPALELLRVAADTRLRTPSRCVVPLGVLPSRRASFALRQCASASRRHEERLFGLGQPRFLFVARTFVLAERLAVRLRGVLLVRAAVADVRARDDERRPRRVGLAPRRSRDRSRRDRSRR